MSPSGQLAKLDSPTLGLEGGVRSLSLGDTKVLLGDGGDTVVALDLDSHQVTYSDMCWLQ